MAADTMGKWKTILQMVTAVYFLLHLAAEEDGMFAFLQPVYAHKLASPPVLGTALVAATVAITVISGLSYLLRNLDLLRDQD